jgi:hypothetical protein
MLKLDKKISSSLLYHLGFMIEQVEMDPSSMVLDPRSWVQFPRSCIFCCAIPTYLLFVEHAHGLNARPQLAHKRRNIGP